MLHKAMMAAAALAAMAVAAAVGVIALAFALYALLRDLIGPAGAAACVAAVSALAIANAGLLAARGNAEKPDDSESLGLTEKLLELVRDKPMASAGVALAAGLLVIRNPAVIGVIVRTLLEVWSGPEPKGKARRGRA